jgi:hypothetical protein
MQKRLVLFPKILHKNAGYHEDIIDIIVDPSFKTRTEKAIPKILLWLMKMTIQRLLSFDFAFGENTSMAHTGASTDRNAGVSLPCLHFGFSHRHYKSICKCT